MADTKSPETIVLPIASARGLDLRLEITPFNFGGPHVVLCDGQGDDQVRFVLQADELERLAAAAGYAAHAPGWRRP